MAQDSKQVYAVHSYVCMARRAVKLHEIAQAHEAKEKKKPEGWDAGLHHYAVPIDDPRRAREETG